MPFLPKRLTAGLAAACLALPVAAQDLTGHGGPVGALAIASDRVLSGSFDTRAILWDSATGDAIDVQRFHAGNITAVAFLPDGRLATAGQDGRIALWQPGEREPFFASAPGNAPISALAAAPNGDRLAAAFWDGSVAVLALDDLSFTHEAAHRDRTTGIGYLPDGQLVSVGSDLRFTLWNPDLTLAARADLPDLPNGLAISDGRVAVVFAEGALRLYAADGTLLPERFLTDRPLVAVASTAGVVAAAAIDGTVWVLDSTTLTERFSVNAGQGPVWSIALGEGFLLTGGADGTVRRWSLEDGTRLGSAESPTADRFDDGSRGAEVWRACAVCHSLIEGDNTRAGPSLHGIYGRRIGTAHGYDYSPALRELDIVWTPETVAALFEFGPEAYTPGSRMPEQRLSSADDRAALVAFLERVSR